MLKHVYKYHHACNKHPHMDGVRTYHINPKKLNDFMRDICERK